MKHNEAYWPERALKRAEEAYLRNAGLTMKLFQEYEAAAKAIKREISCFYAKYANKYGLSYDQAIRLLGRKEFQEWKADLAAYVEKIASIQDPRTKAILTAQLDALSMNSSISRLEALQGQIDLILNDLFEKGVAQMKGQFGEDFVEGYYKKCFDIQSRTGIFNEIAKIDFAAVENVVSYPWSGAMFSDRLWQNKQALIFNAREILTQGLIQGKSVNVISSALADKMGQSYKNAERLVRTESAHIHAESDRAAYQEAGVEMYEYMATLEKRTCEVCGDLDGQHFKEKAAQTGVNYPPIHPNCRCTTVEYDPDDALDWHNSGEPMPKTRTYQAWHDEQEARNGQGSVEIERKKAYNRKADLEQFEAYRTVLPSEELPKDLETFQYMKYTNPERYSMTKSKVHLYNSAGVRGTMPNASTAATPEKKFVDYLLNPNHKEGKHKAHVIEGALGYNRDNWSEFSDKVFREVQKSPVSTITTTKHGTKYKVPVIVYGKKGRFLRLNTVWQIDNNSNAPRLITATFDKKK